jgi:hypothetical protein
MTPPGEAKAIDEWLKQLRSLVEQREQTQTRITKIEAVVRSLIDLLDDETEQKIYTAKLAMSSKPVGLTEVIKHILRESGKLTPSGVRDKLNDSGFPLAQYSNPLAVIFTTVKRLEDQKLVRKTKDGEYEWVGGETTTNDIMERRTHVEQLLKKLQK